MPGCGRQFGVWAILLSEIACARILDFAHGNGVIYAIPPSGPYGFAAAGGFAYDSR
jgi:hypothetical protein